MFSDLARHATTSATLLHDLFADPAHLERFAAEIKEVEHQADDITRDVISRIDKSFVTPIDREDIHLLASRLDNVVDLIDGTARRAAMFHITDAKEPARGLCGVLVRAPNCIESAVLNVKNSKIVAERSREIKEREEEGDAIYHEAVGALFKGTPDPI